MAKVITFRLTRHDTSISFNDDLPCPWSLDRSFVLGQKCCCASWANRLWTVSSWSWWTKIVRGDKQLIVSFFFFTFCFFVVVELVRGSSSSHYSICSTKYCVCIEFFLSKQSSFSTVKKKLTVASTWIAKFITKRPTKAQTKPTQNKKDE